MNIFFVSSEVNPFVKVGGLADVAGALPKALSKLGCSVSVVMPGYRQIDFQESPPVNFKRSWMYH